MSFPDSIDKANATQEMIRYLIECPKTLLGKRRKSLIDKPHHREQQYEALSEDGKYHFRIFLRQNRKFISNFSIGLIYINHGNEDVQILRCNGPHNSREAENGGHFTYHIHTMTADDWRRGNLTSPRQREETEAYGDFENAIVFFAGRCRIDDPHGILIPKEMKPDPPPYGNQIELGEQCVNDQQQHN